MKTMITIETGHSTTDEAQPTADRIQGLICQGNETAQVSNMWGRAVVTIVTTTDRLMELSVELGNEGFLD